MSVAEKRKKLEEQIEKSRKDIRADRMDMSFGEIMNMYDEQEIYYKDYKKEPFRLPDIPEQQRIVFILEKVDKIVEEEQQVLLKLDKLIESRFVDMFGDPAANTMGWPLLLIEEVFV